LKTKNAGFEKYRAFGAAGGNMSAEPEGMNLSLE
jgi:hypothetical protein